MFSMLKEEIQNLNDSELEALSLEETISLEESLCEALTDVGDDLPMSDNEGYTTISSSHFDNDAESFQRHNQDHLGGLDEEDLHDIGNPDHRGVHHLGKNMNESSLVSFLLDESTPPMSTELGTEGMAEDDYDGSNDFNGENYSEVTGIKQNSEVKHHDGAPTLKESSLVSYLLSEDTDEDYDSQDASYANDNSIMGDEDLDDEDYEDDLI